MKRSASHKASGRFHEVKGSIKEQVGRATNNRNLQAEGKGEKIGGKIVKKVGQIEKALGK
jgi:uncharacterized protein YjbJ (UPF0337 family)